MDNKKHKYVSHNVNKRFTFLGLISLIVIAVSVLSLIPSIYYGSAVNSGVNIFTLLSVTLAYRTSKTKKPQMAYYYFTIGFLIYITGNSIFWANHFSIADSYNSSLLILMSLLFLNMLISYVISLKTYQVWFTAGLSLVALFVFIIFQIPQINNAEFTDVLISNLVPIFFLILASFLFASMFQLRQNIHKHYIAKFKSEKQHLTKLINNVDFGYISFKVLFKKKKPVNALVDFYNQQILDQLHIKNIDIDHTKISDLNKNGKLIFENYQEILESFDATKSYYFDLYVDNESYKAYLFKIRKDKIGIVLTP